MTRHSSVEKLLLGEAVVQEENKKEYQHVCSHQ